MIQAPTELTREQRHKLRVRRKLRRLTEREEAHKIRVKKKRRALRGKPATSKSSALAPWVYYDKQLKRFRAKRYRAPLFSQSRSFSVSDSPIVGSNDPDRVQKINYPKVESDSLDNLLDDLSSQTYPKQSGAQTIPQSSSPRRGWGLFKTKDPAFEKAIDRHAEVFKNRIALNKIVDRDWKDAVKDDQRFDKEVMIKAQGGRGKIFGRKVLHGMGNLVLGPEGPSHDQFINEDNARSVQGIAMSPSKLHKKLRSGDKLGGGQHYEIHYQRAGEKKLHVKKTKYGSKAQKFVEKHALRGDWVWYDVVVR
jgi:hypothetical protein